MNKWTVLALLALVAILGGSYYLLSQSKGKAGGEVSSKQGEEMDVEDFDAGDDGSAEGKSDNTYDMLDDPDATQGVPAKDHASGPAPVVRPGGPDIETIEDEDDAGETVKGPVVIEDNDETIETAKPKATIP